MGKTMSAKFAGTCRRCNKAFPAGAQIVYDGHAHHVACVAAASAKESALEAAHLVKQTAWMKALKAGELATVSMLGEDIFVSNAYDYAQAKDLARALCESASAASGFRYRLTVKTYKSGKKTMGREINDPNVAFQGWAFDYLAT